MSIKKIVKSEADDNHLNGGISSCSVTAALFHNTITPNTAIKDNRSERLVQRKHLEMANSPRLYLWETFGQTINPFVRFSKPSIHPRYTPIQRWPTIGSKTTDREDLLDISRFLAQHGQHVIDVFPQVFKAINGTFSDDAPGAVKLAEEANLILDREVRNTDGRQKSIMRKLGIIANLARTTSSSLEAKKEDAVRLAEKLFDDSGLCFGFTEIFKEHSRWLTALWNSIANWVPGGGTETEILDDLNDHLEKTINWAWGKKEDRIQEAVLLLKEAWQHMQKQGKDKSYFGLPNWIGIVEGTPGQGKRNQIGQVTQVVKMPEVQKIDAMRRTFDEALDKQVDTECQTVVLPPKIEKQIDHDVDKTMTEKHSDKAERVQRRIQSGLKSRGKKSYIRDQMITKLGGDSAINERITQKQKIQVADNRKQILKLVVKAGEQIDNWAKQTGDQNITIEISTEGHSMAVHVTPDKIVFLEPEYFGAVECGSWENLAMKLHYTVSKMVMLEEQIDGFLLDFVIYGTENEAPTEEMGRKPKGGAGILEDLQTESLEQLARIKETSMRDFVKEANPLLFQYMKW